MTTTGTSPDISVVIVNWNGRQLLDDCLGSLARQTFTDFEAIVVDNGSTDGSVEWIAEHHAWVRIVALPVNTGFCGGNNAGIRVARGRFVSLLNNDTEVDPEWLRELRSHLVSDERLAAVDPKILYFAQRDTIWSVGATYPTSGAAFMLGTGEKDGPRFSRPRDVFVAVACGALYRKSALDEVGLLDEYLFAGYEDVDWSFRARLHGYRIANVPAARVYHKVSATHKHNSDRYVFHGQRNVSVVYLKNMPAGLLLRYWPLHVLYVLGSLLYFARIGRLSPFLRAKWQVVRDLRFLLGQRRLVQRGATATTRTVREALDREWLAEKLRKFVSAS